MSAIESTLATLNDTMQQMASLYYSNSPDAICRACTIKSKAVDKAKAILQKTEQENIVFESMVQQMNLRSTLQDLANHAMDGDFPEASTSFLRDTFSTLYQDEGEEGGFGASSALIFDHPTANHRGQRNGISYANRPAIAILLSILYQYFLRNGALAKEYSFNLSSGDKVEVKMAEVIKKCKKAARAYDAQEDDAVNELLRAGGGLGDDSGDDVGGGDGRELYEDINFEFNSGEGGNGGDSYSSFDATPQERGEFRRTTLNEKQRARKKKHVAIPATTTTTTTTSPSTGARTKRSREEDGEGEQGKGEESGKGKVAKLSKKQKKAAKKKAKQQAKENETKGNEEVDRCVGWAPCVDPDCKQFYDCQVCKRKCCLSCRQAYGGGVKLTTCQEHWIDEARGDDEEVKRRKAVVTRVILEDI
ncbi:hypothetical protein TrRE_jg10534 [Triparma retinervis]|uniref:Uncharacterized protein n=1 Tax=Triparma retinervis TaxID=2557542 RepID=A0A9W7DZE3_9STRA|nr:hypothetical protein TrRE_jg10534 [Triparma retinervis]